MGAVAELQAVSDEVMQLVEMLDGLNRYRFGGEDGGDATTCGALAVQLDHASS